MSINISQYIKNIITVLIIQIIRNKRYNKYIFFEYNLEGQGIF